MRTITDHVVAGDDAPQLTIEVLDGPGAGGPEPFIVHRSQIDPALMEELLARDGNVLVPIEKIDEAKP